MNEINAWIWIFLIGFFLFCCLFMPVFVWQIKNATQKTNRLLQELIDQGRAAKTRPNISGPIGIQGVDRQ